MSETQTWRQKAADRGQNLFARAVIGLLRALPYERRIPLGGWILRRVVAPLAGYDRRIRANLARIWPDLPEAEIARIVAGVADNLGRTLAELYSPDEFKARVAQAPIRGEGLETILAAQARGQGVILISGHFGNHDIARAMLDGRGHPVAALYRPLVLECVDPGFLRSVSRSGGFVHLTFLALVVLNLVAGFHALGTLLAVGMMMLPAAAARFWTADITRLLLLAAGFGMVSGYAGLVTSYAAGSSLPAGPSIILAAGAIYIGSLLFGSQDGLARRLLPRAHLQR